VDEITSIAALSTGLAQASLEAEVALRTIKLANERQAAALEILLRTLEASMTGLGRFVDVLA
jgi:hypothetical protein